MTLELIKQQKCFGGLHARYRHASTSTGTDMTFSVYLPPGVEGGKQRVPALFFLSGLTCTDENFSTKAGAQRYAAASGVALVMPDTSPRGLGLPAEDDSYDFGSGAGFYVNATEAPWKGPYRMYDYIVEELPAVVAADFPVDAERFGVFGHSMGGHGALVVGLRNPERFRSVSAFSPICAPMRCPWGEKALGGYLGDNRDAWRAYDATEIITAQKPTTPLLVDQGTDDEFLTEQLKPELLEAACTSAGTPLTLRRQAGYDHSYYFIATFVGEHIAWHAARLG